MKRRSKGENIVELTQNGLPSTWFVFTKEISISVSILQFDVLLSHWPLWKIRRKESF